MNYVIWELHINKAVKKEKIRFWKKKNNPHFSVHLKCVYFATCEI